MFIDPLSSEFDPEKNHFQYAYVYRDITYDGKTYTVLTATFKFEEIIHLQEDYMWVKDVQVLFYDTSDMFLTFYDVDLKKDVFAKSMAETITIHGVLPVEAEDHDVPFAYMESGEVLLNTSGGLTSQQIRLLLPVVAESGVNFSHPQKRFHRIEPISFKKHYFRITYHIPDGEHVETEVFHFKDFALPCWDYASPVSRTDGSLPVPMTIYTDQEILEKFGMNEEQLKSNSSFNYSTGKESLYVDLFDRNQVWKVIQDLFLSDLKVKYLSDDLVRKILNDYTLPKLIDWTSMNPISISNDTLDFRQQSTSQFINLTVFPEDKNLVIWQHFLEPKLYLIQRTKAAYFPLFKEVNLKDFQLLKYKNGEKLMSMYDSRFGNIQLETAYNYNISATGFWSEFTAPISTVFVKNHNVEMTIMVEPNEGIDTFKLFSQHFDVIEPIITDKNETYIGSIDKNIDEWIVDNYAKYLLDYYYKLDSLYLLAPESVQIVNNNAELIVAGYEPSKIDYTIDTKDTNIIYPKITESSTIKIVYKRR
jgi:hypothetical protein